MAQFSKPQVNNWVDRNLLRNELPKFIQETLITWCLALHDLKNYLVHFPVSQAL